MQLVVQVVEGLLHGGVRADVEELDADLVLGHLQVVEHAGDVDERGADVVLEHARRDDDEVERGLLVVRLQLVAVPVEDLRQPRPEVALPARLDLVEDGRRRLAVLLGLRPADPAVPRLAHREARQQALGPVVEEVDVDAVRVVLRADATERLEQLPHIAPVRLHVRRVVDDEHGVEAPEEPQRLIVVAHIDPGPGLIIRDWGRECRPHFFILQILGHGG